MTRTAHTLYLATLTSIVVAVTLYLAFRGGSYYATSLEERFYHHDHVLMKPNGLYGHGLGIIGTLLILIGVFGYMVRKRWRRLSRWGVLKYWLEFHIFLCTLGPIMILFHTAFKFGGIVSISFWSMVAVVASGVLGRFIYLQIPRTMQGRELSLAELQLMKSEVDAQFAGQEDGMEIREWTNEYFIEQDRSSGKRNYLSRMWFDWIQTSKLKRRLHKEGLPVMQVKQIIGIVKSERSIERKMNGLATMQKYFRYWHVAHLPFAIIMLIIMIIHVAVTVAFGYTWIF